jgi:hypothetical protein
MTEPEMSAETLLELIRETNALAIEIRDELRRIREAAEAQTPGRKEFGVTPRQSRRK